MYQWVVRRLEETYPCFRTEAVVRSLEKRSSLCGEYEHNLEV